MKFKRESPVSVTTGTYDRSGCSGSKIEVAYSISYMCYNF